MSTQKQEANGPPWLNLFLVSVCVGALYFSVHLIYGQSFVPEYIQAAAAEGRMDGFIQQPYPNYVLVVSAASTLLPAMFQVLVFYFVGHLIPTKSRFIRGLVFGFVLLGTTDFLLRVPLMNLLVGNPIDVVLAMALESWVVYLFTGLLIGMVITPRSSTNH